MELLDVKPLGDELFRVIHLGCRDHAETRQMLPLL